MRFSSFLPRVSTAVVVAACSASASPPIVPVVASDYAFSAPDTVAAGLTAFTLQNRGRNNTRCLSVCYAQGLPHPRSSKPPRYGVSAPSRRLLGSPHARCALCLAWDQIPGALDARIGARPIVHSALHVSRLERGAAARRARHVSPAAGEVNASPRYRELNSRGLR
jgi:hypothetical protein